MTELEFFVETITKLNGIELAYVVTGALASNHWGVPRSTHDLDFVVQMPAAAVPRLVSAFRDHSFIDEDMVRSAYRPPHHFNVIDSRSALKIDFWLLRPEPFERELFSRRLQKRVFGVDAWIVTPEDLILSKLLWHMKSPSEKQLLDVAGVVSVQGDMLDRTYLRRWAGELGVLTVLEQILRGEIRPKDT